MKLTDRQIKNLKPRKDRYEVWEGNGFGIRVFPTGKKSWVYMYRFDGKAKRITFGHYPNMSVAEAHTAYGNALISLEKGIDPGAKLVFSNKENRSALTVAAFIQEYLERWAKPRKRSWQEDERILNKDIAPAIGRRKIKDIHRRDVILILDKIVERGAPITANRTLAVVRRMFNFAVERSIIEITPCYGIKAPSKENKSERFLSDEEIKIFWHGVEKSNMAETTKLALKLQLVTAQRKGEIVSAEWDEFDLKSGWWTLPSEKTKNGITHRVPLSKLAIELLSQLKAHSSESQWLFPSPRNNTHITGESVDHALRNNPDKFENIKQFTPHTLRRTAASHMTALGAHRLVVSKILNHVDNSVTAIYDRHGYDAEKQNALALWGEKISQLVKTGS